MSQKQKTTIVLELTKREALLLKALLMHGPHWERTRYAEDIYMALEEVLPTTNDEGILTKKFTSFDSYPFTGDGEYAQ